MTLAPWIDAQLLQFDGAYSAPGIAAQRYGFTALAGPGGPTPTGGGGNLTVISRARRMGFTTNTGFNPQSIDVPVRFYDPGTYANWPVVGAKNGKPIVQSVEDQISVLEWMWGIGSLYENGSHPATGEPPSVQITSFDAAGNRTNLIPDNWRSDRATDLRWQISALQYGSASRRSSGSRWMQDVVVSLIQQVATPGELVPTSVRQISRGTRHDAVKVISTTALNSVTKICVKHGYHSHTSQIDVLKYNQQKVTGSRLKGKGLHTALKPGTPVYLPILSVSVKKDQAKR